MFPLVRSNICDLWSFQFGSKWERIWVIWHGGVASTKLMYRTVFWQILTKRVPCVSFSPLKELHDKKYNWQFSCLLFLLTKQKTPQTIYIGCFYRNFSSQVRSMKQFDLFDRPGRHTFFIPVDSAFENLGNFKSTFNVCQSTFYWLLQKWSWWTRISLQDT